jgi:hypothetical protein
VRTALRERYERSIKLDESEQTRECVEYLEHPEILVAEFSDSHLGAEAWGIPDGPIEMCTDAPMRRLTDPPLQQLIETPDVIVRDGDPYTFRYVAREIATLQAGPNESPAERRRVGVNYAGLIEGDEPVCVLGVVDPNGGRAPYLTMLRLLTCLAEMSAGPQLACLNESVFKGALGASPTFELQILVTGPRPAEPVLPLGLFTRDLASAFVSRIREEWDVPNLLRAICCVRMNVERFAGELTLDWSS